MAGLAVDAIIAPWLIEGAMNGALFADWSETRLAPVLAPGTVMILDNLSTHEVAPAAEALRHASCWFLSLPAYSPDPCVAEDSAPDGLPGAPRPSRWPSPNSRRLTDALRAASERL